MLLFFFSCLLFENGIISLEDSECSVEECENSVDDGDGDGYSIADGDCNDQIASISPIAEELCDGVDNDCDGAIDFSSTPEGDLISGYLDADLDGVGGSEVLFGCTDVVTWSEVSNDCDDQNSGINPMATEVCDGVDNDCDDAVDDDDPDIVADNLFLDQDGDGFGSTPVQSCNTEGLVELTGDCDDLDPEINPGIPEVALDLIDQNCDGSDVEDFGQCGPSFGQDIVECTEVIEVNGPTIPFQRIEAGSSFDGAYELSQPFSMMSTELTNQMAIMLSPNVQTDGAPLDPVTSVNWYQSAQIANYLTNFVNIQYSLGLSECYECSNNRCTPQNPYVCSGYRLPTNAEWDLASRAGTSLDFTLDGTLPDGGSIESSCQNTCEPCDTAIIQDPELDLQLFSWFCMNSNSSMPVGITIPNPYGLFDMQGNVSEWTHDRISSLQQIIGTDPWTEVSNPERSAIRGGSWANTAQGLSNNNYNLYELNVDSTDVGFRLVRTLPY